MILDLSKSIDANKARAYLEKLIADGHKAEIKRVRLQRTIQQNKYLHVCLGLFCEETGYTIDEAKELFSLQLPEMLRYEKNGISFRRSTADLDTKEMTILIDKIREMALEQLGLYIPDAQEYLQYQFELTRQVEGVR